MFIVSFIKGIFLNLYRYIVSGIRHKLILIISAVLITSIFILIYISLFIFEDNMTNMIIFLHSKATSSLSEKVTFELESYVESLDKLATTKSASALFSEEQYSSFVYVADLENINGSLRTRSSVRNESKIEELGIEGLNNRISKVIASVASIKQNNTSSLYNITEEMGKPLWLLVISQKNKFFVGLLELNSLLRSFNTAGSVSYTSFLVNIDGDVILHPNHNFLQTKTNFLKHPVVSKMYSGGQSNGVLRFTYVDNEKSFGAFERINSLGVGIVSVIPESLALEGVQVVRVGSFLISMVILSLAIIVIYFFSSTLTKPILHLVEASERIAQGDISSRLSVDSKDELGVLTRAFNSMSQGLQEREQLKGALGKFVNEEIANQALKGELSLGGQRNLATIFFSDIRGFTAISEKLDPEGVVEFLNEYMTIMVGIIHESGGVVDKFIGDAIMAIWGTPVSKGNDVERCLDATLKMRYSLIKFNRKRLAKKEFPILIGCGINTGDVLSGQIGSPERLEYTVIGDAVNTASRIEALCKPFAVDIIITENTYNVVQGKYEVLPMQKVNVKGKGVALQVYALLGKKNDPKTPKSLPELRRLVGINWRPSLVASEEKKYSAAKSKK